MILQENLHYLYGSPSTVRDGHVARQVMQVIHADYFWGNLLVNKNLEEQGGDKKTTLKMDLRKIVKSEGWNWLRIMPNGMLWYKWCQT